MIAFFISHHPSLFIPSLSMNYLPATRHFHLPGTRHFLFFFLPWVYIIGISGICQVYPGKRQGASGNKAIEAPFGQLLHKIPDPYL
jgi:hypothetical protein